MKAADILIAACFALSSALTFYSFGSESGFNAGTAQDIAYLYRDSKSIALGENPYLSILGQSLTENTLKYTTYLPGFFVLGAFPIWLGIESFADWLEIWKLISAASFIGIGLLLFVNALSSGRMLAVVVASSWCFSRWSLYSAYVGQIDHLAALFLVASLLSYDRRPKTAFLLLGISLALKQVALPLVPLLLVDYCRQANLGSTVRAALIIAAVPLVLSFPFLVHSPEAFFKSILFSATRDPASHLMALNLDQAVGSAGYLGKFIFIAAVLALCRMVYEHRLGLLLAAFLALLSWISFSPVFFVQYCVWPLAVGLLLLPKIAMNEAYGSTTRPH